MGEDPRGIGALSSEEKRRLAAELLERRIAESSGGAAAVEPWFPWQLKRYREAVASGHYFYETPISDHRGARVVVDGRGMLMMASYSYLGLLGHPRIEAAAQRALADFGTGTHGVRMLAGTLSLHRELEAAIADFKKTDDAVVYSSGFIANVATIAALVGEDDAVIGDHLNHASIVDGCLLSRADFKVFAHNDMEDLERCLEEAGPRRKLVVADAVFSMDGDIVNLPEVIRLCRSYGALLMIDEAHSLGVLGETGRGIEEHFGVDPDAIDVKMGTLSKAIPSVGGYVAASSELITGIKHSANGFIFSAALPAAQAAAARAALEVMAEEPERVHRLRRNLARYMEGLRRLGFDTLHSETPIVPILCETEEMTLEMTRRCLEAGVFVMPIVYPAVPLNLPRLRTIVSAMHTEADIDLALEVLERAARECGMLLAAPDG